MCASEGGPYKIKNKNKEPSQEWLGHKRKAPASEGGRYKSKSDPRGRGKPRPYKAKTRKCGLGFD